MIKAEIAPLKNFPIMYGFIDKSQLDIVLHTWKTTEIPPNPNKNEVQTSLL